jgi:hypothetical protein
VSAFTHEPRAPRVPRESAHSYQRWFTGPVRISPPGDDYSEAEVYRNGDRDVAEVRLMSHRGGMRFDASLELAPAELRELALRLLDAAHDLEAFPATEAATPD